MQHLEVSGAVQPIYGSLGVKRLMEVLSCHFHVETEQNYDKHPTA